MEQPYFSIVMPVHNSWNCPETLDSLLAQSYSDFELIVVDNGSSAEFESMLDGIVRADSRIRLIKLDKASAGIARNTGLDEAGGKYVLFLDSDDIFSENLLRAIHESTSSAEADVVCYGWHSFDSETGKTLSEHHLRAVPLGLRTATELRPHYWRIFAGQPWDKAYKRSFVRDNGLRFEDRRHTNDLYFVFLALYRAESVHLIDKDLVAYRMNSGASTRDKFLHEATCGLEALDGLVRDVISSCDLSEDDFEGLYAGAIDQALYMISCAASASVDSGTIAAGYFTNTLLPYLQGINHSEQQPRISFKSRFRLWAIARSGPARFAQAHHMVAGGRQYSAMRKLLGALILLRFSIIK